MAEILYGAPVREKIKQDLVERIKKLGRNPVLVIVQVGNRDDSNIYIRNKIKFGEEVGVKVELRKFEAEIGEGKVIEEIQKLNTDESVDGIIVQLPLPEGFDTEKVVGSISKNKDADGLVGSEREGEVLVTPATARAVMAILDFYNIKVAGKKVVVLGRSKLAGGPIAEAVSHEGAVVSVCTRDTENNSATCKCADVLISATGNAHLIDKSFVAPGQVIVDVGINRLDGKLTGDADFDEILSLVSAITPVPGGVGVVTVACLFENLLDLCYNTL